MLAAASCVCVCVWTLLWRLHACMLHKNSPSHAQLGLHMCLGRRTSALPNSPSKQGHQFSGVRGFVVKSPVELHKVCVLQLSTDGLQLVVRLVNNLGLYFHQGFGGVNPSLWQFTRYKSVHALLPLPLQLIFPPFLFHPKLLILIWICDHV